MAHELWKLYLKLRGRNLRKHAHFSLNKLIGINLSLTVSLSITAKTCELCLTLPEGCCQRFIELLFPRVLSFPIVRLSLKAKGTNNRRFSPWGSLHTQKPNQEMYCFSARSNFFTERNYDWKKPNEFVKCSLLHSVVHYSFTFWLLINLLSQVNISNSDYERQKFVKIRGRPRYNNKSRLT